MSGKPPRAVFLGSGRIGLPSLRLLGRSEAVELAGVVTQPDRPAGRGRKPAAGPVKLLAQELGVPVLQPARLREGGAVADLRALEPALLVVLAYGQILSDEVLAMPGIAAINLHASLLPRHRGASPIPAAILAGDTETGITVMHISRELDAGDLVLSKPLSIFPEETAGALQERLAVLAADVLEEALPLLIEGRAPRSPQNPALATYAPKLRREDGRLDWKLPADRILRRIRAFDPWPGSFTHIPSPAGPPLLLKIWKARQGPPPFPGTAPGTVFDAPGPVPAVAAGTGTSLIFEEVQLEGRKRMRAEELLRGFSMPAGIRLGNG